MKQEYILTYADETGLSHKAPIQKQQFSIGRGPDNDLVISNSNLSRHHAVVELVSGSYYVSDSGSQNGTFVNGRTVIAPMRLSKGDIIDLGGGPQLKFEIGVMTQANDTPSAAASDLPTTPADATTSATVSNSSEKSSIVPLVAGLAIGLILLGAIVVIAVTMMPDKPRPQDSNLASADPLKSNSPVTTESPDTTPAISAASPESSVSPTRGNTLEAPANDSDQEIGRAAQRVMSRISKDNSPYISESGIKDVAAKVRQLKGSGALTAKFRALSRGCLEINTLAQANSLKPALLSYAAIAESEGAGDPLASAKQMAPKLLTLRATFGTDTANSTLLLLAAYPYPFNPQIGSQTRTPHPLAAKLVELGGRRSVEDTSVARTVWFLKDKNGIMPEAYDLVVRFLAVGIISQAPRSFGIDSDPLFC